MEEELAAVEEEVERKRVAKNPFELKFTSLVRVQDLKLYQSHRPFGHAGNDLCFENEQLRHHKTQIKSHGDMYSSSVLSSIRLPC